jgi:2-polyprenyl-3-methyl-5-hydroxy-6-metoxy-1,4-benzoquinol methylase
MTSVAAQSYWDTLNASRQTVFEPDEVLFQELFERHLPQGGTCFEVGCYPGNFLIWLARRFGYTVSGIDATPLVRDQMPERLAEHGVRVGDLQQVDFLAFESARTFDVVCSFGFIEHFRDTEDLLERHVRLVAPGGTLVISCPNFRNGQYLLHRLLDAENLRRHVLASMDLTRWRRALTRCGMSVLHDGYYGTFDFWTEAPPEHKRRRHAARYVRRIAQGIDRRVRWPNRILSPHMIMIARKPL